VAGAVQDHDRGVIVGSGSGRTYGKGLVQTITPLPSDAALKVTVAFYYTPSGRCIQSVTYKEGGVPVIASGGVDGDMDSDSAPPGGGGGAYSFEATDVLDADRKEFRTDNGRVVRDGGGIEADVRVALPKMSTLEGTLQGLGAYFDYAGVWSRSHEFTQTGDVVNDATLQDFKHWVLEKQKDGEYRLDAAFEPSVRRLEKDLTSLGMEDIAQKQVAPLRARIAEEVAKDFVTRKEYIREELTNAILARYLPESMLLKEQLGTDEQFKVALAVAQDPKRYSVLLEPPSLPENSKSQE
jgi:carboxyl-terminal processing protease